MPVHTDYSLADLARLADVTPRTIRYYVAQGLLPSPDAAGPATRYSDGHLARLRLIRRMQRDHLPLAEIREQLEQMSDGEVAEALAAMGSLPASQRATADPEGTVGYIRSLMEQARIEPNVHPAVEPPAQVSHMHMTSPLHRMTAAREDLASWPEPSMAAPAQLARASGPAPLDDTPLSRPSRSTWERVVITPDIEIHVRRPLKPLDIKRADHLERYARELFQDEP
jgi:DNA-binding transcriptional MerR regulator